MKIKEDYALRYRENMGDAHKLNKSLEFGGVTLKDSHNYNSVLQKMIAAPIQPRNQKLLNIDLTKGQFQDHSGPGSRPETSSYDATKRNEEDKMLAEALRTSQI